MSSEVKKGKVCKKPFYLNIHFYMGLIFSLFIIFSFLIGNDLGKDMGNNFYTFTKDMVVIIPCAFILIGLFEVWVKKETIEKHLGEDSGFMGYLWMILLSGTTVGGMYVAFPVAYSLYKKGARFSMIFTYVGASSVCRIPMTVFEASFMGVQFTIIRLLLSVTLLIIFAIILEKFLKGRGYKIMDGDGK